MYLLYRFDVFHQNPFDAPQQYPPLRKSEYFYTDAEEAVQVAAQRPPPLFHDGTITSTPPALTWQPLAIKSSPPTLSAERRGAEMRVVLPKDGPIPELFRLGPPNESIWLTVYVVPQEGATPLIVFIGNVRGAVFSSLTATLEVMPLAYALERPAARVVFSRQCPYTLYGDDCGVSRASYRGVGTVADVSSDGLTLTLASDFGAASSSLPRPPRPDGYFDGGYVVVNPANYSNLSSSTGISRPHGGQMRMIQSHVGLVLALVTPVFAVEPGAKVVAYKGCSKTFSACKEFGNERHFGGFPFVPQKNPFVDGLG